MSLFNMLKPLIFHFDAERAHGLTVAALRANPFPTTSSVDPILASNVCGINFPNPVGLAAGFDKNAQVPHAVLGLGFGFVEVGTLTPLAQAGNAKPRLFRLVEDEAVINRMGFNNDGQQVAHDRLVAAQVKGGVVGVNIGANKDAVDRIADYVTGIKMMSDAATYLTVNISSPNTPGLRALQDEGALAALLDAVDEARAPNGPPLFLKVAPDLAPADIDAIARLTVGKVDALIVSNTTISRPPLKSRAANESGGLSGGPLRDLAQQRLIDFRAATGGQMPLIGVGGIASADDAYARIRAGASLLQIYSALVFHGPGLGRRINAGLKALLQRDGFTNVAQAVGADVR
jgi:dihydroorotate dehydrogenase